MDESEQIQGVEPIATATRVTSPRIVRFAVAAFDTWPDAQKAVQELRTGQKPLTQISYLGLRDVLIGGPTQALCDLPFPDNTARIACTTGPIAERLSAKLAMGATSLQAALTTWLISRHAAQQQRAVEGGKIVVWVGLADDDDERRAYRTLLDAGCGTVGVHDLVGR